MTNETLSQYQAQFKDASAETLLAFFLTKFQSNIVLASSLGAEDQVLTHMAITQHPKSRIFVLDTGRLHQETYDVMAKTQQKYKMHYEVQYPQTNDIEKLVSQKGPNSFYESIENRKECCAIRKIHPLNRILATCHAWITGIRHEQSVTRETAKRIEWDSTHNILKLNPLLDWSTNDVWTYIKKHKIPYNTLHDAGYPSIGCAPCTRAIKKGEDIRAGRWWWESAETKECGLHFQNGKIVRKKSSQNEGLVA